MKSITLIGTLLIFIIMLWIMFYSVAHNDIESATTFGFLSGAYFIIFVKHAIDKYFDS